ncbi:MAG: carboxymuconolactone decarboxylase family protein [Desulfobacteraceae bacterium]|nr:MAG: carboxymuconolactone decarboxylase family protein [Desulfobacteraceae bacterium]
MDPKTQVMVAMGAAIGANCIPCFDHLYAKGREVRLSEAEIEQVVEVAFKVKNGAGLFLKKAIGDVTKVTADMAEGCGGNGCSC